MNNSLQIVGRVKRHNDFSFSFSINLKINTGVKKFVEVLL